MNDATNLVAAVADLQNQVGRVQALTVPAALTPFLPDSMPAQITEIRNKLNEIVQFLTRVSQKQLETKSVAASELPQILEDMATKLNALGNIQGLGETEVHTTAGGKAILAGEGEGMGLLQQPPLVCGYTIECYRRDGQVWTGPDTPFTDYNWFAKWVAVHPCSADYGSAGGAAGWIDAATTLYVEFPCSTPYNIGLPHSTYLQNPTWTDGSGYYDEIATGVRYCPAGTVIHYFEQDGRSNMPNGNKVVGIEAGWIRQLPWIMKRSYTGQGTRGDWGDETPLVTSIAVGGNVNEELFIRIRGQMCIDPTGRIMSVEPETTYGIVAAANLITGQVTFSLVWHESEA